jgi:hexosaminidase
MSLSWILSAMAAGAQAAPALVPSPVKMVELGGCTTNAAITYRSDPSLAAEAYRLKVTDEGALIESSSDVGRLYARVTLDQLTDADGGIAKVAIEDAPAYPYRGWLIDVARHWLPKDHILDILDIMAMHKLNVLHWHLTDDEGWRLPTGRHPELIEYGSVRRFDEAGIDGGKWRRVREWVGDCGRYTYGPFCYSRKDIAEVLACAKARGIKVLPEFDVPGHSRAFLAAYPQYGCEGMGFETNRVCRRRPLKRA